MIIKLIAMANGDVYEDVIIEKNLEQFIEKIQKREFIKICAGKQEILINSDFIVSLEV